MEIFGELLVQLVLEVIVELLSQGIHRFSGASLRKPIVAAIAYSVLGAAMGGLSLLVIPTLMIRTQWGRWVNLAVTPLICGLLMAFMGTRRAKRNEPVLRLDRFSYGWLFALAMATVRFVWGQ